MISPCSDSNLAIWRRSPRSLSRSRAASDSHEEKLTPSSAATARALVRVRSSIEAENFRAVIGSYLTTVVVRVNVVFRDECEGITPALEGICSTCGAAIVDPFKSAKGTLAAITQDPKR